MKQRGTGFERKTKNKKEITLKYDRYLDVQNINKKIMNLKKKIMNLALLVIVTWKSKDEIRGIIKLLSIIIPMWAWILKGHKGPKIMGLGLGIEAHFN